MYNLNSRVKLDINTLSNKNEKFSVKTTWVIS